MKKTKKQAPLKVSVIIPTIGRHTLVAVLHGLQQCAEYDRIKPEIIVVWNGDVLASPRSAAKGKKKTVAENQEKVIEKRFKGVKFLHCEKKHNVAEARNLALSKSKGDIIAFLGDDTVPGKNWLRAIVQFHSTRPDVTSVMLGKIDWPAEWANDPFHQWLLDHAQFAYASLIRYGADWRHFYTSNISLKKKLIGRERFNPKFKGWGFEDAEFGFRLAEKGMRMHYIPTCRVVHHHRINVDELTERTGNARKNAAVFEKLHPEVHLLPKGRKKLLLRTLIVFSILLAPFSAQVRWWREWKKAWLGD